MRAASHIHRRARKYVYNMYVAFYDIVVFVWIFHKTILSILYGIFGNMALSFFFKTAYLKFCEIIMNLSGLGTN